MTALRSHAVENHYFAALAMLDQADVLKRDLDRSEQTDLVLETETAWDRHIISSLNSGCVLEIDDLSWEFVVVNLAVLALENHLVEANYFSLVMLSLVMVVLLVMPNRGEVVCWSVPDLKQSLHALVREGLQ